jgi:hypothetical protein
MALDLQGWVTPEQDFKGLYNLSENFRRQGAEKKREDEIGAAKQAGLSTYLQGFLDPKEYLTGTVYDPHITKRISEIMMKGMDLAKMKGMDNATLYAALSPDVNKLTKESLNIREVERRRKEAEGILKGQKGIDLAKVNDRVRRRAYYNEDGSLKDDLSSIDPTIDYADMVLRNDDVYTPDGLDEIIAKAGKNSRTLDTRITDANKGSRRTKLQVSSPEFMQPVIENGTFQNRFEPRYEFATDNGQPIEEVVIDEATGMPKKGTNGQPITQKAKMLMKDDWNMLLDNKAAAMYLRQEIRKYAKEIGVDPNSTQAINFGKTLGWDMLNRSSKGSSTFSEVVEQKAAPIVVNNNNGSGGKGGSDAIIRDVYNEIYTKWKKGSEMFRQGETTPAGDTYRLPVNELSNAAQGVIIKQLSEITGGDIEKQSKFYIKLDPEDGMIKAYRSSILKNTGKDGAPIGTIDFTGTNLRAGQPNTPSKVATVEKGNNMKAPQPQKETISLNAKDWKKNN